MFKCNVCRYSVGGAESGRLPDLPSLLTSGGGGGGGGSGGGNGGGNGGGVGGVGGAAEWEGGAGLVREVLLVDRQTDEFLTSLDDLAKTQCGAPPNAWDRAFLLAKLVAERMGGAVSGGDGAMSAEWRGSSAFIGVFG